SNDGRRCTGNSEPALLLLGRKWHGKLIILSSVKPTTETRRHGESDCGSAGGPLLVSPGGYCLFQPCFTKPFLERPIREANRGICTRLSTGPEQQPEPIPHPLRYASGFGMTLPRWVSLVRV